MSTETAADGRWIEIYAIRNRENGKTYVGQSINGAKHRWRQHVSNAKHKERGGCTVLANAINKYGTEAFDVEVIDKLRTGDMDNKVERLWIDRLDSRAPNGYNLEAGGDVSVWEHHPDTIDQMKQTHLNRWSRKTTEERAEHTRAASEANAMISVEKRSLTQKNVWASMAQAEREAHKSALKAGWASMKPENRAAHGSAISEGHARSRELARLAGRDPPNVAPRRPDGRP